MSWRFPPALTFVEESASFTAVGSATPHTKGAWTEVIASTTAAANWVRLFNMGTLGTQGIPYYTLADIGVGAAGSEAVVVADIGVGSASILADTVRRLPAPIPAGSRVAMRVQGSQASQSMSAVMALERGPETYATVTIGADAAASRGSVSYTQGANAWTQVVAATAQPLRGLILQLASSSSATSGKGFAEVGVGGSGAEVVVARVPWRNDSGTEAVGHSHEVLWVPIPEGSRLSIRSDDIYAAGSTTGYVHLIGVI